MNLQARFDLEVAKDKKLEKIHQTVKPRSATEKRAVA
jgi:hypothetical protein